MLIDRRELLFRTGAGLGAAVLSTLLGEGRAAAPPSVAGPLAPRRPHFEPRARRIIYLHMIGAPSQLDLFDPKPALVKHDNKPCPPKLLEGKRFAFLGGPMTLAGSSYRFARHGQSGQQISELLPHLAAVADELCVVRSLRTDEINHAPAQMFLHTGAGRGGRPAAGAWLAYGLGSPSRDLPAYVVMVSGPVGGAGASLWGAGFLPGVYQGTRLLPGKDPVLHLSSPAGHGPADRRRVLDAVAELNRLQLDAVGDPVIATRIQQYELAFRMQSSVPELTDLSREPAAVREMYGVTDSRPSFANNCLLARRLVEGGVRVVQLFHADWDHHNDLATRLPQRCREVDQPAAALIRDLKQRGLLDDTLVVWAAEFGRTPLRQGVNGQGKKTKPGRDHHKDAYTAWLAGGGIKRGISHGSTDELGFDVAEAPVHVHDLNATILHLMGLDHEKLTFRYQGRDHRLTDVHGKVVRPLLA
jgi:uncharacterized protein (DUF1501 family)